MARFPFVLVCVCACSAPPAPEAPRLVVTADWLAGTLTLFDHAALVAGADAGGARVGVVDLAAHAPGPLQLELTPDGRRAVVAVSPGFFDGIAGLAVGATDVPPGGTLLVVDLETRSVLAEIETRHVPMGLSVSPDGTRAYTANFGETAAPGSSLSVIDLETFAVVDELDVGPGPEQVSLDAAGEVGLFNTAGNGSVRAFRTADPAGTLSPPLVVSADSSDVTFVGPGLAVVASSIDPAALSVVDVSDPGAPALVETVPLDGGLPYGATAIPGTASVLVTVGGTAPARLVRAEVDAGGATITREYPLGNDETPGLPLGVALDGEGRAFLAVPGDDSLAIVDLESGAVRHAWWLDTVGPTYVAVQP